MPGLPRGVQALGASGPGGASLALLDVDALHPEDPPLWQLRLDSPSLRCVPDSFVRGWGGQV